MTERLTVRDAAARFSVSPTTIKNWASFLPGDPIRDGHGRRRLSTEDLQLLEIVRSLRAEDRSNNTITRRVREAAGDCQPVDSLRSEDQASGDSDSFALDQSLVTGQPPGSVATTGDIRELLKAEISKAFQANTDLAEKYARAAHQIGKLEAEVTHLRTQLEESQARVALRESRPTQNHPWWQIWAR